MHNAHPCCRWPPAHVEMRFPLVLARRDKHDGSPGTHQKPPKATKSPQTCRRWTSDTSDQGAEQARLVRLQPRFLQFLASLEQPSACISHRQHQDKPQLGQAKLIFLSCATLATCGVASPPLNESNQGRQIQKPAGPSIRTVSSITSILAESSSSP